MKIIVEVTEGVCVCVYGSRRVCDFSFVRSFVRSLLEIA